MENINVVCNRSTTPQHDQSTIRLKVGGHSIKIRVINNKKRPLIRKMKKSTAFFNGVSFLFRYFRNNSVILPKSTEDAFVSDWERIGGDMYDAFVKYNILLSHGEKQ